MPLEFENALPTERAASASTLQRQAQEQLDCAPRQALASARAALDLAKTTDAAREKADAALTLAIVLNRLGKFRDALELCRDAEASYAQLGDDENYARTLCQAAWALDFIGNLNQANDANERARAQSAAPLVRAQCDWIEARVLRDRAQYSQAAALFERARDAFAAASLPLQAARCERELAHTYIHGERKGATALLEHARQSFESAACALDVALCDYVLAIALLYDLQNSQAIQHLASARSQFIQLGAGYFAACCDLELGIAHWNLNRLDESLEFSSRARDAFLSQNIPVDVSACDINRGNAYYSLNRYDEALASYQEAADLSPTSRIAIASWDSTTKRGRI